MHSFYKNFTFIKQILKNAFKINVEILKAPYTSMIESDYGLRKMFWKDFKYDDTKSLNAIKQLPENQIIYLNSKLGFSNILYRVPSKYEDCILFIGPFLIEENSSDFFNKIILENNFPKTFSDAIKSYYQTLPYVEQGTILNTLQTLLSYIIPEFIGDNIKTYNFITIEEISLIPEIEATQDFSIQLYDEYLSVHNSLFQQIGNENYKEVYNDLDNFLQKTGLINETNIENLKDALNKFNIKCEYIVLQKKVHYLYIQNIYLNFKKKIIEERSREKLLLLPYEMVKNYSLIVKYYSLDQYSPAVRCAINYINFNLNEPLSLSYIANKINKNSSFLSSQFKKDTGYTITNYIHKSRIEHATRLLSTTSLSIQEVAEKVGMLELNYFSKLFKKYIGMSPTEYKKLKS